MRLTKLEHATLLLDQDGSRLIIDPGSFTPDVPATAETVAVVITHEHADHWTNEHLSAIVAANPDVRIIGPAGVAAAATDFTVETVEAGRTTLVGPFELRFFGGDHAVIHSSIPIVQNLGVLVNDTLYYAGDSFFHPEGVAIDVLAAPSGAPWMKVAETIDYVLEVAPRRVFATHEMVLSEAGKSLSESRLKWAVEQGGGEYIPLAPGDSVDL